MESENKPLLGRLVTIDSEGNETEIMGIAELTPEKLTISADNINLLESGAECSINIKTITRKRFIKLLMSHGIARNGAKDLADYVHKKYGEYNPMLFFML